MSPVVDFELSLDGGPPSQNLCDAMCLSLSGLFAVANRVTVYRRNVDLIGRARHATVYRYRHTRDPRVCLYRGIPSENGEFHVLCV